MSRKTFLGMGLLGSNFVKSMLKRGEEVRVWNRTASKAKELELFGARAFENIAEAVEGVSIIHLTLKDDASVDEVLEKAGAALAPGTTIIDHTTTSKEGAIRRTAHWKAKGMAYQHAPVFMGPANALASTGYMLVSGDQDLINRLSSELTPMTGKLMNLGTETGKAAAIKLVGNSYLVGFSFALRESLAVAKSLDVSVDDIFNLFKDWNPGAQAEGRLKRMTSEDLTQPSWELAMARKDTGLFLQSAKEQGISLELMPVIARVMDEWIAKGYGNHDWAIVAKDYV